MSAGSSRSIAWHDAGRFRPRFPGGDDDGQTHAVHLRSFDPGTVPQAAWPDLLDLLDDAERARADRFRTRQTRDAFISAHALLRVMLCDFAERQPADWRFTTNNSGKPILLDDPGLHFNISHCHGMVLLGVARGIEVGVDVEDMDEDCLALAIADRFFAPSEAASLRMLTDPMAIQDRFIVLWTLKEAFTKASGRGVFQSFNDFTMHPDEPTHVTFADPALDDARQWRFWQARGPRHRFAAAYRVPTSVVTRVVSTRASLCAGSTVRFLVEPA